MTMASKYSKWKHCTFSFIIPTFGLLLLITNYLYFYFTINYTDQLQHEFPKVSAYLKRLRNHERYEVVSQEINNGRIMIGLKNDKVRVLGATEIQTQTTQKDHVKNPKWFDKDRIPGTTEVQAQMTQRDRVKNPKWFDVVAREFKNDTISIGLVNTDRIMLTDEAKTNVEMVNVRFDPVGDEVQWSRLAPEWVHENDVCPEIPMPRFEDYRPLDVVVARASRGPECENGGVRDVFRLQVNLVVANVIARSRKDSVRPVFAVFLGSCDPMMEIFRCDDLFWSEGNLRVYKPQLNRIKHKGLMPVGSCQFVPPISLFGEQESSKTHNNNIVSHGNDHIVPQSREAYVTILHTSEDYVCGAIVLGQSIIQSNSTKDLILLVDDSISPESLNVLRSAGWKTLRIERIRSPFSKKEAYNEWNYSKLRIWQLTQYDKLIFLDADLLVIRNLDGFFTYPEMTAVGNYQRYLFNSGLMVVQPSECTFATLMEKMTVVESYNGGDQGFLNEIYGWWHRLPHQLNYMKVFVDPRNPTHLISEDVYVLHYTGFKPWTCPGDDDCNWEFPDMHRYASNSAHRLWRGIYRAMPEKLRPYCSPEKYRNISNPTSAPKA